VVHTAFCGNALVESMCCLNLERELSKFTPEVVSLVTSLVISSGLVDVVSELIVLAIGCEDLVRR
jgi:hypothetical protein